MTELISRYIHMYGADVDYICTVLPTDWLQGGVYSIENRKVHEQYIHM